MLSEVRRGLTVSRISTLIRRTRLLPIARWDSCDARPDREADTLDPTTGKYGFRIRELEVTRRMETFPFDAKASLSRSAAHILRLYNVNQRLAMMNISIQDQYDHTLVQIQPDQEFGTAFLSAVFTQIVLRKTQESPNLEPSSILRTMRRSNVFSK